MSTVIGIDPGARTGAIAFMRNETVVHVDWLPFVKDGKQTMLNVNAMDELLESHCKRFTTAVIERQQPMPKQGVSSTFVTGSAYGALLTYFQCRNIPVQIVNAQAWKKKAGLIGKDKDASRAKVAMLFPNVSLPLKKDHNKADAILIGHYG
jgi:crossover junction endodeoxyribonuclease RuvC